LAFIADPSKYPNTQSLLTAGRLLNSVASEVHQRIERSKNAVVFNISDRLPLSSNKQSLLLACGMSHHECGCVRLRKKSQRCMCPLPFQFREENMATEFIRRRERLSSKPPHS
ncbi:hypothetical protein FGIG_00521, partial [Fasciola gigantica]